MERLLLSQDRTGLCLFWKLQWEFWLRKYLVLIGQLNNWEVINNTAALSWLWI